MFSLFDNIQSGIDFSRGHQPFLCSGSVRCTLLDVHQGIRVFNTDYVGEGGGIK